MGALGEGGMGEVYRARDTRLNRTVALKVLPHHLSDDPAARARFEREGQTLAALSHPNLVAIYDVGRQRPEAAAAGQGRAGSEGTPPAQTSEIAYVVMELVDGETLRSKLMAGRLPLRRVIEYAAQIARGLSAAHDKGLVHRDLKPANIIVAADGHVKILDFGLAKTFEASASGATTRAMQAETGLETDPGTVVGTVGYMAPEQVRGLATDARTDLFSFGTVLHEMVTGRRAFERESAAETMAAIVKDEAPAIPSELDVPPALERILRRCLEKRPEDRFRSAADLAFQIETLSAPSGRLETTTSDPAPPRRRRSLRAVLAAAAIFAAGLLAGWLALARVVPPATATNPADPVRMAALTYSGADQSPAASPDGRTIAFVSARDGVNRIWLRQLATGDEAALTTGNDFAPRFSPDGASILFARREPDGSSALYRVPVLGGQPRKLVDLAFEGDWSPDGTRLAFVRQHKSGDWRLGIAAADGSGIRESPDVMPTSIHGPRWSPDGMSIVVSQSGIQATLSDRLLVFHAATLASSTVEAAEPGGLISIVQWLGIDFLYAQSPDVTQYSPETRIVLQSRSGGGRTLAWVPGLVHGFELMRDGTVLFDTSTNRQNLRESEWTSSGLSTGTWLTRGTSTDRQPAYSPDGKWITFSAMRNGNLDLWLTSPDTGESRRLTDDAAQDWDPAFTPDGKHLMWSSNRGGYFEIWLAEADGRNARQLTRDGTDAENPTATRDGWVLYSAGSEPTMGVWKIRLDGSQATQLVKGLNSHPEVSPDGQYVLYHTNVIGNGQVLVARIADGQQAIPPIPMPSSTRGAAVISPGRGRWSHDGRSMVFVGVDEAGRSALYEQAFRPGLDTTATRRLLKKSDEGLSVESFGISPDGKRVTISYVEDQFAIMRLEGLGFRRR
jgi:serine/threonine protein kinase/Tol biopolymer transport system component